MSFSETISPFLGRCMLVWFYLTAALNILGDWHHMAAVLSAKHVPVAPLVLLIVMLVMLMRSISLLLGYHARYCALMLFGLTIVGAVVMDDFWHIAGVPVRPDDL